jgi:hypothetical protein
MANAGLLNPFGNGGRTDNSAYYSDLDKDLVLSASDMGKTITITKSNNYGIRLPDARQLIKNVVVNIVNKSTTAISISDNNGFILKVLPINQTITCCCINKLSSSGTWNVLIVGSSLFNSIGSSSNAAYINNGATNNVYHQVCMLSSTLAIGITVQPWTLYISALQISGSAITHLSTSTIAWSPSYSFSIDVLNTTTAILVWSGSWTVTDGCIITYTSSTLTVNPTRSISTTYGGFGGIKVCAISSTTAILISSGNIPPNNHALICQRLTISGTAIATDGVLSLGNTSASSGSAYRILTACKLSSTTLSIIFKLTDSLTINAIVISNLIGSGALTSGSPVTVSITTDYLSSTPLSNSIVVYCYAYGEVLYTNKMTISGTTITSTGGVPTTVSLYPANCYYISMCTLSPAIAIVQYNNATSSKIETKSITLSGSLTIISNLGIVFDSTVGYTFNGTTYTGISDGYNGLFTINSTTALSFFAGPTGSKVALAKLVMLS